MGVFSSRQNAREEEVDSISNNVYKYPPKSGNYFSTHFIMGGEKFDTPQPEAYLFGENMDLNFFSKCPSTFPYPPPEAGEPTKPLKSLVNIRKESLRFVKTEEGKSVFNIEFIFDCDAPCSITIYYFCTEEFTPSGVSFSCRDPSMTSEVYHYKRGSNQQFYQPLHLFNPSLYNNEDLIYMFNKEVIPIAIHCVAHDTSEETRQSHTTIAVVEQYSDGSYILKALKQKLFVDGLCYLLQEIYGIENKSTELKDTGDEELEDGSSECVICMSDMRDTLILPCRHLCLCQSCADSLRYQANNCPICRVPFRALLQIKALQKTLDNNHRIDLRTPYGYETVPLIEALNGPNYQKYSNTSKTIGDPLLESSPDSQCTGINICTSKLSLDRLSRKKSCSIDSHNESFSQSDNSVSSNVTNNEKSLKGSIKDDSQLKLSIKCKDNVKVINEKGNLEEETPDEDSEAEKMSPLLDSDNTVNKTLEQPYVPVVEKKGINVILNHGAEDADCYGECVSHILSTHQKEKPQLSVSQEKVSLPGTPMSTVSQRSSGESYTSKKGKSAKLMNY
ncbi:probable E3 ubiquitin-protein ligase MGRN1 isoform X2 [Daktulosphaira vitifoliae]|uniref:probable E3 ubiquitin-protein ligase MGRN1 isoform X2 n=1 Tax=Daktulosphaira vitifoliae TaxID=58002 RepID=UPI0021AA42D7|nr:probable E3 ubiquitin-protein ligase MGRN1 isoform X2 [Daktulosphaira vitifoliae]